MENEAGSKKKEGEEGGVEGERERRDGKSGPQDEGTKKLKLV